MSAKAETFEGTQRGVSWTGAWIAAILLTAILALSLFAVNRSSGTSSRPVPATAKFEITTGGPGGPSRLAHRQGKAAAVMPGVQIGDTFCHQCR